MVVITSSYPGGGRG